MTLVVTPAEMDSCRYRVWPVPKAIVEELCVVVQKLVRAHTGRDNSDRTFSSQSMVSGTSSSWI